MHSKRSWPKVIYIDACFWKHLQNIDFILKNMFLRPHGYESKLRPLFGAIVVPSGNTGITAINLFTLCRGASLFPRVGPSMHLSTHFLGVSGPVWGSQDIMSSSPWPRTSAQVVNSTTSLTTFWPRDPSIHPTQNNTTDHHYSSGVSFKLVITNPSPPREHYDNSGDRPCRLFEDMREDSYAFSNPF